MRVLGWTVAAVLTLWAFPAAGVAGWSTPQTLSAPGVSAMAVNARGQTAIAWVAASNQTSASTHRAVVAVVVRTAGGRVRTRRVWSSKNSSVVSGVSVAIDDRGVVTVAWASARLDRVQEQPEPVRAAYGPLAGRWAAARVIGHASSFGGYGAAARRYPHLAVAPSGEVLLSWDDDTAPKATLLAAWREPGHRFGAPRVVGRSPNTPLGAIPAFDTHGRAYLSSACYGLVLSAAPRSHRFGTPVLVAPGGPVVHQALSFSLSLSGAGQGLASWVDGACTGDAAAGDTEGPVYASVLHGGRFGPPIALSPAGTQAFYSNAVAVPVGGGMVTWAGSIYIPTFQDTALIVQIGADGRLGAQPITDARAALAADGRGDVVFAPPPSIALQPFATPPTPVFVRPAGGGVDQPAPASYGQVAVAAPVGRAVALLWNTSPTGGGPTIALSVWRP